MEGQNVSRVWGAAAPEKDSFSLGPEAFQLHQKYPFF